VAACRGSRSLDADAGGATGDDRVLAGEVNPLDHPGGGRVEAEGVVIGVRVLPLSVMEPAPSLFPRWHARPSRPSGCRSSVNGMSVGAAIALGALAGLALGVLLSVTTGVPLGPELGLLLGGLVGWLSRRDRG
jgi:hypothetical protein